MPTSGSKLQSRMDDQEETGEKVEDDGGEIPERSRFRMTEQVHDVNNRTPNQQPSGGEPAGAARIARSSSFCCLIASLVSGRRTSLAFSAICWFCSI